MKAPVLCALVLGFALVLPASDASATTGQASAQEQEQEKDKREKTSIDEIVIVTASRTEQLLLEAPTSISVIDSADIALSPALNYADLLRGVPGLNITQVSARDMNMSARSATSTLDASQLVLLDGRSVYQDFFGFVMWDLLPVDLGEIDRIEVARGPASAVWGANAMTGVINIITKSPFSRGNAVRVRAGGGEQGTGFGGFTWTGVREKLGFRVNASYYTQDPWGRPGPLPNGIPRDSFANEGSKQPKFDGRFDYNISDNRWWSLSAGYSGTSGISHTGIGPFQVQDDSSFWYVRGDYNVDNLNIRAYANVLDGNAVNLLNGLLNTFETETYDFSATNTTVFGQHSVTYGGNYRTSDFALSLAPAGEDRTEGGGFAQFDLNLNDYVSVDAGARVDSFSNIDGSVVSPRGAVLIRPTGESTHVVRASFGRAFRAPSVVNNYLDITVFNLVALPTGPFVFASDAVGNQALVEEQLDQWEIGYRGSMLDGKFSWDIAAYRTETTDNIDFFTSGVFTAFNPPPGWPLPPFFLPPFGPILLPSDFSYRNIGEIVNKGVEIGLRIQPMARNTVVINYSWQDNPEVTGVPVDEVNRPPTNRFNLGWNGYAGNVFYGAVVNFVDEAYWSDVLDSRFFGYTDSFTTLDLSLGLMFDEGNGEISVRATNITDEDTLQHIFGDIIGRRIVMDVAISVR